MMLRRKFLKTLALIGSTPAWAGPSLLPPLAHTGVEPEGMDSMAGHELIAALRDTGKPVCGDAAERLESAGFPASGFNLHLRGAGLTMPDALAIALALNALRAKNASPLRSFSISYNPGIGAAGAVALVNAFPASLIEIGMVGCDLGDESGEALMQFARTASKLKMMCIEDNRFSSEMRQRLGTLRNVRADMLLVV